MKVYGILGTKQAFVDKGQAVLMTVFFFLGAVLKNIVLLVVLPAVIFAATFFVREKMFSGKAEWWIFVLRMFGGGKVFYCRQHKDVVGAKK
ncbi:hypothetical protein J6W78_01430 [bacterium]|nr:hypothetical protein [bacterium]